MPRTPPSSSTQALSPPPPGSPPQLYGMGPAVEEPSSPTPNVVAPRHLGNQRNKGDLKNLLQRFKSVQHDINVLVNELEEIVDN